MQVKKFEAPTIQEALDTIKRELGPEAIILQTKTNKRGFGLLSKGSVEITAAISDRSIQKKKYVETRIQEDKRQEIKRLPATRQADIFNKYAEKYLDRRANNTQDRVEVSTKAQPKPLKERVQSAFQQVASNNQTADPATNHVTKTRYIDIAEDNSIEKLNSAKANKDKSLADEVRNLKQIIRELKEVKNPPSPEEPSVAEPSVAVSQTPARMAPATLLTVPHATEPSVSIGISGPLNDAFDQLILNGLDKRFAISLVKQIESELGKDKVNDPETIADMLAFGIMNTTEVQSPLLTFGNTNQEQPASRPEFLALVGPTGVGKTTTLAKIASEAILKRKLKVGLINLDSYKVAAFDQLATYAKILGVPFRSANSAEDVKAVIQDFQHMDLVLVDTTGRSQRDTASLRELQQMLSVIPNLRTNLVLSVTTRDTELYDTTTRFSIFRPLGLIMSKLDEATIHGSIYNVSQKAKLPLIYFTTGQRVPEDLEEASRERVAALILDL